MAEPSSVAFACNCGKVRGNISPISARSGTHLICCCRDCRAAELYLQQPDPAPGGVDLYQTTPDTVHLDSGSDKLGILRLSPKGPLRWYATCCKSPLFNTLTRPGVPFVTVNVARLSDPALLGPVVARSFVPQPDGSTKHQKAGVMVWRLLTRVGAARLSGRWKQTPFFDVETGTPTAPVHLLTKEERTTLYK